ncbi:MAG: hypothetical protein ACD_75C01860G0003 [uncultured bacterium]|nr:MAG: hypothetical protein ACD_75C01860G0003 [uncultured bacterium]
MKLAMIMNLHQFVSDGHTFDGLIGRSEMPGKLDTMKIMMASKVDMVIMLRTVTSG